MPNTDEQKIKLARHAIHYLRNDTIIGIGTGSTVDIFIDELRAHKDLDFACIVSSSKRSTNRLEKYGFTVTHPNNVDKLDLYIDSTDYFDDNKCLIKGAGGALTQEKILANLSDTFVCLADNAKHVSNFFECIIPIEVLAYARSMISRILVHDFNARPTYRINFTTDNNNVILDIASLDCSNIMELESKLKSISGVVESGIFARRRPEIIVTYDTNGIKEIC